MWQISLNMFLKQRVPPHQVAGKLWASLLYGRQEGGRGGDTASLLLLSYFNLQRQPLGKDVR